MANIFLSYDRDDEARARPIAKQLELAGHSVWWDRQIKGGGEFSAEIEAALGQADKVVVLWSERAVRSAWVRDEAAVGRDTGRLVPATLDGTPAPLGFRQFQTIDLSRWKGRGGSPELDDLLNAMETGGGAAVAVSTSSTPIRFRPTRRLLLGAGAALAIAGAGVLTWQFWPLGSGGTPTFAIVAADSSSSSREVAHDLGLRVADLSSGSGSEFQLVDAPATAPAKPDFVLSVGAGIDGGRERRNLALRSSAGAIFWSASIDQPASISGTLPQQVAVQAQRILSCAAEALSYRRERIGPETLKQYLAGCTSFDSAYGANLDNSAQIKLFEQVLAAAPHFEPAWSKLLTLEIDQTGSADNPDDLLRTIATHVRRAHDLGLDFGELYAAKAAILPSIDFIGIFHAYDEGIRRHPDNAVLYRIRGEQEMHVGRMIDSVADVAHAVQLDPLSPANLQTLASAYAYSGNTDAAYAQLRKAEQLWPGAPNVVGARYRLDLRFGDPKEALALLQDPIEQGPFQTEQAAFLRARISPTPENIQRAIAEDTKIYQQYPFYIASIVQSLAQFGRKDEVLDILLHYSGGEASGAAAEVLFRPAMREVWRDPHSIAAAAHLGLLHYWKASGRWPDFCSDSTLPYDCKKEAAKYKV